MPVSPELAREEGRHFIETNEKFRRLIEAAITRPSMLALEAVDQHKETTIVSTTLLQESLFFRASGDEKLIKTAVGTVMHEAEQNWKLVTEIDSGNPPPEGFPEGLRDILVAKLMEEESDTNLPSDGLTIDMDNLETLSEMPADALAFLVCSAHEISVEDLYRSLMTSGKVLEHSYEQAERERQQERIVTVGLATVGAFIASSLAYFIAQRRKK